MNQAFIAILPDGRLQVNSCTAPIEVWEKALTLFARDKIVFTADSDLDFVKRSDGSQFCRRCGQDIDAEARLETYQRNGKRSCPIDRECVPSFCEYRMVDRDRFMQGIEDYRCTKP